MSDSGEDVWGKFCKEFDDAVFECIEKGTTKRFLLDKIIIDIYPQGGSMKKYNELMLAIVKDKTGIDLAAKRELGEKELG